MTLTSLRIELRAFCDSGGQTEVTRCNLAFRRTTMDRWAARRIANKLVELWERSGDGVVEISWASLVTDASEEDIVRIGLAMKFKTDEQHKVLMFSKREKPRKRPLLEFEIGEEEEEGIPEDKIDKFKPFRR